MEAMALHFLMDYAMVNELIFSMHWLINGVNEGSLACTME